MKLCDLLEISKNRFLIVRHDFGSFRIVQNLNVVLDDQQQITTELFFGLDKFANNGPAIDRIIILSF